MFFRQHLKKLLRPIDLCSPILSCLTDTHYYKFTLVQRCVKTIKTISASKCHRNHLTARRRAKQWTEAWERIT